MRGDKVQLGARIPRDLYRQLRVLAAEQDASVGEMIEEAIRDLLEKAERGQRGVPNRS